MNPRIRRWVILALLVGLLVVVLSTAVLRRG